MTDEIYGLSENDRDDLCKLLGSRVPLVGTTTPAKQAVPSYLVQIGLGGIAAASSTGMQTVNANILSISSTGSTGGGYHTLNTSGTITVTNALPMPIMQGNYGVIREPIGGQYVVLGSTMPVPSQSLPKIVQITNQFGNARVMNLVSGTLVPGSSTNPTNFRGNGPPVSGELFVAFTIKGSPLLFDNQGTYL